MIKVLVVDDEPRAVARLSTMLTKTESVEVIGTARNVTEAEEFLKRRVPDVIFLDIDMPGRRGVDLLDSVPTGTKVVFVTAHEGHAIDAFRFGAVDYVLKPFDTERLAVTLTRLVGKVEEEPTASEMRLTGPGRGSSSVNLVFDSGRSVEIVALADIAWIEAVQNYTRVQAVERKPGIIRRTLREWEEVLAGSGEFHRLDRSLIIRLPALRSTQWQSRDQMLLVFHGVTEPLPIGRVSMRRLRELLGTG